MLTSQNSLWQSIIKYHRLQRFAQYPHRNTRGTIGSGTSGTANGTVHGAGASLVRSETLWRGQCRIGRYQARMAGFRPVVARSGDRDRDQPQSIAAERRLLIIMNYNGCQGISAEALVYSIKMTSMKKIV